MGTHAFVFSIFLPFVSYFLCRLPANFSLARDLSMMYVSFVITDVNAFLSTVKAVIQQQLAAVEAKTARQVDFPTNLLEGKGLFPSLAEFLKFMRPFTSVPLRFGESNDASTREFNYGFFVSAWLKYATLFLGMHRTATARTDARTGSESTHSHARTDARMYALTRMRAHALIPGH